MIGAKEAEMESTLMHFYHPRKDGWDFLAHFIDNTDTDKMQIHFLRNNVYILNFNVTR